MITKTFDPAKYKLVPKVATQGMISRVIDERMNALIEGTEHTFIDIYNAMLAAAPEAPDAEPVNVQLLEAAYQIALMINASEKQTKWFGGRFVELQDAIAASEQQQAEPAPELTDDEIDAIGMAPAIAASAMYLNCTRASRAFARAVIAADRAKRGA